MTGLDFSRTLPRLAEQIRAEHEAAESDWRSALGHALRAGELLNEAKERVEHGDWSRWLRINFPASERTARLYMQAAANRQRVAEVGATSLREAVKAIAKPRPEP